MPARKKQTIKDLKKHHIEAFLSENFHDSDEDLDLLYAIAENVHCKHRVEIARLFKNQIDGYSREHPSNEECLNFTEWKMYGKTWELEKVGDDEMKISYDHDKLQELINQY